MQHFYLLALFRDLFGLNLGSKASSFSSGFKFTGFIELGTIRGDASGDTSDRTNGKSFFLVTTKNLGSSTSSQATQASGLGCSHLVD
ncbi:hypothetical protein B9Y60_10600 [Stenotrophomonas maltophilia]|nr:hypothetical protein B9Y73_10600 [Stenotrophomonas maltophilia]PJL55125.1 hypothetical protein B9Y60_10600 [Stenotrophomonas maltophilia]